MYAKNQLDRKTKAELLLILADDFGTPMGEDTTRSTLIETIITLQPETSSEISPEVPPVEENRVGTRIDPRASKDRVRVLFHEQENDKSAISVMANGVAYQIPRGIEVEIPRIVLGGIENAVMTVYEMDENGVPAARDVPRFAYTVLR